MQPQQPRRYTVLKGHYWIHNPEQPRQGPQPDGDTVTFIPASLDTVRSLRRFSGQAARIRSGRISLRYEGVDTLETHFEGTAQNPTFAYAARDFNLRLLGFNGVRFFKDRPDVVEAVENNPLPGFVLANGVESNGRVLGLVYAGETDHADGEPVFVDEEWLGRSVNTQLVEAGLAYVEPYDSMPMDLVEALRGSVAQARERAEEGGMWAHEDVSTARAATIGNLDALEQLVMWPKLFRRLSDYFREGRVGLDGFDAWIRQDRVRRDDSLRLPNGEKANMHDTYVIDGDRLSLAFRPEQLLITPDPPPQAQ